MSQHTKSRSARLASYSALAGGVVPVAAAAGAIVSQTGLNIMATPGSAAFIDFGPGFGEVFQFSVYTFQTSSFYTSTSFGNFFSFSSFSAYSSQAMQFNPANTGGWTQASLIGYAVYGYTTDPRCLSESNILGSNASGWFGMAVPGPHHLLSNFSFSTRYYSLTLGGSTYYSTFGYASSHGDWDPQKRGFLGVRFSDDGVNYHYAWFDVTADRFNQKITIHGWAYNDEANATLHVPAPAAGLGVLALGAAGIRRSRRQAA